MHFKKFIGGLGVFALVFMGASFTFAKDSDDDASDKEETTYATLEEIKAEPYSNISGKWEVEVEFDDEDYTVYVYEVDDETDLFEKIADAIKQKFGFQMTIDQVKSKTEVDDDGFKDDDDDDDFSGDVTKIEAEQYNGIDGKWKIEVKFADEDAEFYLYNIDDKAELTTSVREKVNSEFDKNYSEEKISSLLDIDDESSFDDDDSDKDDDKDGKDDDSSSMSDDERSKKIADLQAQLEKLIKLVMKLLSLQLGLGN